MVRKVYGKDLLVKIRNGKIKLFSGKFFFKKRRFTGIPAAAPVWEDLP